MAKSVLLSGCKILTGDGLLDRGDILVSGKKIRKIAPRISAPDARLIRARGLLAAPGLIDSQINGGFGVSFGDASPEQTAGVGLKLLDHGVTSFLPTLISLPYEHTLRGISNLVAASKLKGGARILGIHLEGPFLAPECRGAHPLKNLRPPSIREFRAYVKAGRGMLRMMTIAPERPGAFDVIREGTRRGVIMAAGHSMAKAGDVIRALLRGGLRHVTHVFNAMAPLHHREESILNAALVTDRLSCGMIYDRHHLSAGVATLLMRVKPAASLVLVSDARSAWGLPEGEHFADGEHHVIQSGKIMVKKTGRLAGSVVSLLDGVRCLIADTDVSPERALFMASGAPARLLGVYPRKGVLRPGSDADIALFGKGLRLKAVLVEGEVFDASHH